METRTRTRVSVNAAWCSEVSAADIECVRVVADSQKADTRQLRFLLVCHRLAGLPAASDDRQCRNWVHGRGVCLRRTDGRDISVCDGKAGDWRRSHAVSDCHFHAVCQLQHRVCDISFAVLFIILTISGVRAVLKLQSCPEIVKKFEIVLKSQSFSTNVLILTIVVRAQWQFNLLLAALLICLLRMWIQFYVLFLFETVTIMVSCITVALVIVMTPFDWFVVHNT